MSQAARATMKGLPELLKKLQELPVAAQLELRVAVTEAAFRIQRTAKTSIQKSPPDGKPAHKGDHVPSKPGNAPRTDTGKLVNSIFVTTESNGSTVGAKVGTTLGYGKDLEFGTKNIAARPWLFPAQEANRKANERGIFGAITKILKKYGGRV